MDATVWLYWLGGQALGGAGVAVVLWALLGDRLLKGHTKRRCPKCWHDLSATPGLTCPECGKTARSEARLFRSRKRRRLAAVGVVGVVLGTGAIALPQLRGPYWPLLLPTPVLAAVWPEVGVAEDSFLRAYATEDRLGTGTKSGLSALALRWSTGRVLRSDLRGPRESLALSMLAKAGLRSEAADATVDRVFALNASDSQPRPSLGELQNSVFGYIGRTHPPRELFDALSAWKPGPNAHFNASIERAMLDATLRDPSLIERWLQLRVQAPFPTKTDWPRAYEPEWAPWWQTANPRLIALVSESPRADQPNSFTNLLRFGLSDWATAIGKYSSVHEIEPLFARVGEHDEVARIIVLLLYDIRMPGLTHRMLELADVEQGGVFATVIAERAKRGVEPLSEAAAQFFVRRLASEDPTRAAEAVQVLDRAPPSTVGPLLDLLAHADAGVRERAVRVIGGIKPQPQEVYVPVRRLAEDPAQPASVRAAARAALGWWPEPAAEPSASPK